MRALHACNTLLIVFHTHGIHVDFSLTIGFREPEKVLKFVTETVRVCQKFSLVPEQSLEHLHVVHVQFLHLLEFTIILNVVYGKDKFEDKWMTEGVYNFVVDVEDERSCGF